MPLDIQSRKLFLSFLYIPSLSIYIYIYIERERERSNQIISYNTFPFSELLDRTNVVHMFKCPLRDCVSKENSAYVGLTTATLSRRLTMHLNDSSSVALHLKTDSISKSKFRKILVENTTIIAHEINKLRLQILEALHI